MTSHCHICYDKQHYSNALICHQCLLTLPFIQFRCGRCGITTEVNIDICGDCQQQPPQIDKAVSTFSFLPPVSELLHSYKQGDTYLQHFFKQQLLSSYIQHFKERPIDAVAAVPSSPLKTLRRGFVPALPLAQHIAYATGLPDLSSLLHKKLFSLNQKNKSRWQRLNSKSFWLSGNSFSSNKMHGRETPQHILLIDDVITTGASINQLAKLLKTAGIEQVFALSIAHTPRYH